MSRKSRKNTEKLMRAIAFGSMACFAVLCIAGWSLSGDAGAIMTSASVSDSSAPSSGSIMGIDIDDETSSGEMGGTELPDDIESSSEEPASVPEYSSEPSSEPEPSSVAEPSSIVEPSSVPVSSESEPSSEPEPSSEEEEEPSSEEEEDKNNESWEWNESDARDWEDEEEDDDRNNSLTRPSTSSSTPSSSTPSSSSKPSSSEEEDEPSSEGEDDWYYDEDVFEQELTVKVNGKKVTMEAYDMICQVVANEIGSSFHEEAIKAQAVAAYTMIVFNNNNGTAPTVGLRTNVASRVEDAVAEVLGEMVYYNGKIAHTVYHSTSAGETTSATEVWGGNNMDYLASVDSYWDEEAPGYESISKISPTNFASLVDKVYGIDLWDYSDDPADWLEIESYNSGGYVGTVSLGGRTTGRSSGSYGAKTITGRSIRETLLSYQIRSHCFEYSYDEDSDKIIFTTYGYGHGVGMSQYGAQFMALDGYDYEEILTHYYTGTVVK